MKNTNGLDTQLQLTLEVSIEAMKDRAEQVMAMYKGVYAFLGDQIKDAEMAHTVRPHGIVTNLYIITNHNTELSFETVTMMGGCMINNGNATESIIRLREQLFQKLEDIGVNVPE